MNQLAGLFSPNLVKMRVVNASGSWFTRNPDGSTEVHRVGWNWDGNASAWARFWVIIYPPSTLCVHDGTWDENGGTWEDTGGTYGSTATFDEALRVRQIVTEWGRPWHCQNIILSFDESEFDPRNTPAPTPNPAGNWQLWGNRSPSCCYWDGSQEEGAAYDG